MNKIWFDLICCCVSGMLFALHVSCAGPLCNCTFSLLSSVIRDIDRRWPSSPSSQADYSSSLTLLVICSLFARYRAHFGERVLLPFGVTTVFAQAHPHSLHCHYLNIIELTIIIIGDNSRPLPNRNPQRPPHMQAMRHGFHPSPCPFRDILPT